MFASLLMTLALAPTPAGTTSDTTEPTVEIVDPSVAVVAFGAPYTFTVAVEANDEETGVQEVALMVNGALWGEAAVEPPYSFEVSLEAGFWTLTAEARDHRGNVGVSNDQSVLVIDDEEGTTGGGEASTGDFEESTSTGDEDDDDLDAEGGSSSGDENGETPPEATETELRGCTTGSRSGWGWMLAVVAAGLGRRRRRAA